MKTSTTTYFGIFLFLILTSINFRLRLGGDALHLGGAEFSIAPYDFAFPFILFSYYINTTTQKKLGVFPTKNNTIILAFLMLILSLPSIYYAPQQSYVIYEAFRFFKMILLFIMISSLTKSYTITTPVINAIKLIISFEFLFCLYQLKSGNIEVSEDATAVREVFVENGVTRVSGTLRHPGTLSLYINMLTPFIFYALVSSKRKIFPAIVLIIAFLTIIMTYSRSQIISYVLSMALCLFFFQNKFKHSLIFTTKAIIPSFLALALLVVIVIINGEALYDRFFNAPESSTTSRIILNLIALNMFEAHPIIGTGWNNFVASMPEYDNFYATQAFPYPVHNMYLLILSETGILGLGSYLLLITITLYQCYQVRTRTSNQNESNFSTAAAISLSILLITGLQGWSFRLDSINALFWFDIAIITGVYQKFTNNERRNHNNQKRVLFRIYQA